MTLSASCLQTLSGEYYFGGENLLLFLGGGLREVFFEGSIREGKQGILKVSHTWDESMTHDSFKLRSLRARWAPTSCWWPFGRLLTPKGLIFPQFLQFRPNLDPEKLNI